jgi:uroporphyrinogen-III synthase
MRVIVTRPAAQAASWVHALQQQGIDAHALPLIEIAPAADPCEADEAWRALPSRQMVVFVSPNAAEQFLSGRLVDAPWPAHVGAASVGPGTTQVLRRLGVPPDCITEPASDAPQFDSESLWEQLRTRNWAGASVLVVRGDGGRDWLADRLRAHGADVAFVSAYRRIAPQLNGASSLLLDEAIARPADHLWFFSSSEAVGHLAQARPHAAWTQAHALVTHPRIARRVRDCGFGAVHQTRPTLEAVVACIQSIAS